MEGGCKGNARDGRDDLGYEVGTIPPVNSPRSPVFSG